MQRRTLLKSLPAAAVPVALAGCQGSSMPDKQCKGASCDLLEEWSWEWENTGALNPDTLTLTFIPEDNSPNLEIEFRGYSEAGGGDPSLVYAGTYTVKGAETIIEEGVDPVHAAEIEVTPINES